MQEDIRLQLKSAIAESESELEKLSEVRKRKRLELRQLRKALTALGGPRRTARKGRVLSITSRGEATLNADDSAS